MKNWWYYHKWYVICGIIFLDIACNVVGNALGLWHKAPDFQIAYIGKSELPQDTVFALENSTKDKTILWADCPALAGMELGFYSTVISGEQPGAALFAFFWKALHLRKKYGYLAECCQNKL